MTVNVYRNVGSSGSVSYLIDADPSIAPGIAADIGVLCTRTDIPSVYCHTGPLDTDWTLVGEGSGSIPFPGTPVPVVTTIYARTTGSDTAGDGTLASPYLTLLRATRDVPLIIPAGFNYVIDITGITEVTPSDYALPAWKAPYTFLGDPSLPPFFIFTSVGVAIQATPRLTTLLTVADATIAPIDIVSQVAQTGSGFILLTIGVARAAWAANAIKGKFLIGATAFENAVIVESTNTTLLVSKNAALTGTLTIMEPSCSITCSRTATAGTVNGGFIAKNVDSLALRGLKIVSSQAPGGAFGLEVGGNGACALEMCELEAPLLHSYALQSNRYSLLWIYDRARFSGSWSLNTSFLDALAVLAMSALGPVQMHLKNVAVMGGPGMRVCQQQFPGQSVTTDAGPAVIFKAENVLIANALGATVDGIRFHGLRGTIRDADIRGCGRDGIRCETGNAFLDLVNVRCTVPNGVSAVGYGIRMTDGMICKVDAATSGAAAGTELRGTAGANNMLIGSGATRLWTDFVSGASGRPALNEYDLIAVAGAGGTFLNPVPLPSYVTGTGTRLFQ